MVNLDPRGEASLDPRGLIGRIYVVDHQTLLHTKHISCGSLGFREVFLKFFFSILSLWKLLIPWAGTVGPQGIDLQDICSGPLEIATY